MAVNGERAVAFALGARGLQIKAVKAPLGAMAGGLNACSDTLSFVLLPEHVFL